MLDASCRGLGKSTLDTSNPKVIDECFCLSLAEYTYPPLNKTQYYLPPSANDLGDVTCDCNTVMYRCGIQISQRWTSPDLRLFSLYMACASCQGGQIYS